MNETEGKREGKTTPKIRWLADHRKIDRALIDDYGTLAEPFETERFMEAVNGEKYDIIVISGSPYFVETMSRQVRKQFPKAALVLSNDATMCCGEGICGACNEVMEDGRVIRRCKCR